MKRVKVYGAKNKKQAIDKIAQDVSEIYKSPMYSVTPNYDRWTVDVYDVNNNLVLISILQSLKNDKWNDINIDLQQQTRF